MAYRMQGTYVESCNCELACPCTASNLALPATYERCTVLFAFHVETGDIDGVEIEDLTVGVLVDAPQQMTDGGWRVGLLLDERAGTEQREALTAVFGGDHGGPAALFGVMAAERLGVEVAPISFHDDGFRHTLRIGDAVDLEVEDFPSVDPQRAVAVDGIGHPAGQRLAFARGRRARISAFGLEMDNSGRNAHSAPFEWRA